MWLWQVLDYSCGKRLVASLGWLIPKLEEQRELRVNKSIREKLLRASALPRIGYCGRSGRRWR